MSSRRTLWLALVAMVAATLAGCVSVREPDLVLWHAYRGQEADALFAAVEAFHQTHPDVFVEVVSVPNAAYANKITSAVPRDNGPDVFIFAQERIGGWAEAFIIRPLDDVIDVATYDDVPEVLIEATVFDGSWWGVPLATKTTALFYNRTELVALGAEPPTTTDEMIALAERFTDRSSQRFGLVYVVGDLYFHSAWLFGFGGSLFDEDAARPTFLRDGNAASLAFARRLRNELEIVPRDAQYNVVSDRFATGNALFAINGPWFLGELAGAEDLDFGVVPLPVISETGTPARPFVTVESAYVTTQVDEASLPLAAALIEHLASPEMSVLRAVEGRQAVANVRAYDDPRVGDDPILAVFAEAARRGQPMPNRPDMLSIWEPGNRAIDAVLRGVADEDGALEIAEVELERALAPPPPPRSAEPYVIALGLGLLAASIWVVVRARRTKLVSRMKRSRVAYLYVAPAALGSLLLIFAPFVIGATLSLYAHEAGEFTFVGFANFLRILSTRDFAITHPQSFFFTMAVTVAWTVVNVALHVTIGLAMAMALRDPWVKLRGVYRVLLIIPWAIPNYITALIWRAMFNVELGAVNAILGLFGVEPVDWFSSFATSFCAVVATNTWLGFPFMMVVSLGALQSIPRDLEDAAEVDGASRWQRFRHITLPLLKPALVPAVILGSVWTFNMFNIIYLVSEGNPSGSTDILITEAYKWAFQRQERYGYAAAYGVLIFGVLLMYTWLTTRRATDELVE